MKHTLICVFILTLSSVSKTQSIDKLVESINSEMNSIQHLQIQYQDKFSNYNYHKKLVEFYVRWYQEQHDHLQRILDGRCSGEKSAADDNECSKLKKEYDTKDITNFNQAKKYRDPHAIAANKANKEGILLQSQINNGWERIRALLAQLHILAPKCFQNESNILKPIACCNHLSDAGKQNVISTTPRIGVCANIKGTVMAQAPGGVGRIIKPGTPIYLNDHVTTSENGGLQVMLLDETVFTLGPKSDMVLDEFVYDPNDGVKSVFLRLIKGTFRMITSTSHRHEPSNVKIRLPVAAICIRGTDFQINIFKNGDGIITLFNGSLEIRPDTIKNIVQAAFFTLDSGQSVRFHANSIFDAPKEIDPDEVSELKNNSELDLFSDRLAGDWKWNSYTYHFSGNGSGKFISDILTCESFDYVIDEGQLIIENIKLGDGDPCQKSGKANNEIIHINIEGDKLKMYHDATGFTNIWTKIK